jgi:hypothetical protein
MAFKGSGVRIPSAPQILSNYCGAVPKWLRERSAKPPFGGSNPPGASNKRRKGLIKSKPFFHVILLHILRYLYILIKKFLRNKIA